jgi:hypothetical protein
MLVQFQLLYSSDVVLGYRSFRGFSHTRKALLERMRVYDDVFLDSSVIDGSQGADVAGYRIQANAFL